MISKSGERTVRECNSHSVRGAGLAIGTNPLLPQIQGSFVSSFVMPKADQASSSRPGGVSDGAPEATSSTDNGVKLESVAEPAESDPSKPKPQTLHAASTVTRAGRVVTLHVSFI